MPNRKLLVAAAIAGGLLVPALSNASQTFEMANDEIGVVMHYAPTSVTREQVREDLAKWNTAPVASDGWRDTRGEWAWQPPMSANSSWAARPPTIASQIHQHWLEVNGEAGWVGPFGV